MHREILKRGKGKRKVRKGRKGPERRDLGREEPGRRKGGRKLKPFEVGSGGGAEPLSDFALRESAEFGFGDSWFDATMGGAG